MPIQFAYIKNINAYIIYIWYKCLYFKNAYFYT